MPSIGKTVFGTDRTAFENRAPAQVFLKTLWSEPDD